jgi:hypothetical protein
LAQIASDDLPRKQARPLEGRATSVTAFPHNGPFTIGGASPIPATI